MPYSRKRFILDDLNKKLSFSRVVLIQGCRQAGKSYLAREILPKFAPKFAEDAKYVTFDQLSAKTFAAQNPETFLKKYEDSHPLIIDEAQKVPPIFDAIKFEVDQNPKPGQYILLGSSEFSKLLQIRESLTGRVGRIRLFPLTLAECLEIEPSIAPLSHLLNSSPRASRNAFLKHLERGGFPGIFAARDESSRNDFFQDWLSLTLERDLHQFPRISVDTDLATEVIQRIALIEEPNATNIAKGLRKDTRTVQKILNLLETLFVVNRVSPYREGTGKSLYFLCDVGLSHYLGANFERQIWTWLIHEQLAQRGFRNDHAWKLYYYRNSKGKHVHLILENIKEKEITAIKLLTSERIDLREFEILRAFKKKIGTQFKKIKLIALGPMSEGKIDKDIDSFPWESLA